MLQDEKKIKKKRYGESALLSIAHQAYQLHDPGHISTHVCFSNFLSSMIFHFELILTLLSIKPILPYKLQSKKKQNKILLIYPVIFWSLSGSLFLHQDLLLIVLQQSPLKNKTKNKKRKYLR
jgi:hypothetical protein